MGCRSGRSSVVQLRDVPGARDALPVIRELVAIGLLKAV
jgi:hypothetical protein